MKIHLLSILLILSTKSMSGQENANLTNDSDTAYWYKLKNQYAAQFKFGLIENDTSHYSFRLWSDGLTIKVANTGSMFTGEIVRFVEKYPTKTKKTFIARYIIPVEKVIRIIQLIDSFQIRDLPSDKNIKGWRQGFDGIEYLIEYKQSSRYSFKNYWTPTSQDSLKEAIQLQTFIVAVSETLDLPANFKKFEADIPFSGWKYPGSASAVLRIKSKSAKKKNGS